MAEEFCSELLKERAFVVGAHNNSAVGGPGTILDSRPGVENHAQGCGAGGMRWGENPQRRLFAPWICSDEEFLEWVPVVVVPAPVEVVVLAGGEAGVVEDQRGLGGAGFELEVNDRVDAGIPMGWPPCLHDPLVEDQFDIAANDEAAELREGSSRRRVNCGGHAAEGSELLLVEDGFVEPLRAGMKVDLVMDGSERPVSRVGGLLGHGWLLRAQGRQRGYSQRCGDGGEGAAAGRRGD